MKRPVRKLIERHVEVVVTPDSLHPAQCHRVRGRRRTRRRSGRAALHARRGLQPWRRRTRTRIDRMELDAVHGSHPWRNRCGRSQRTTHRRHCTRRHAMAAYGRVAGRTRVRAVGSGGTTSRRGATPTLSRRMRGTRASKRCVSLPSVPVARRPASVLQAPRLAQIVPMAVRFLRAFAPGLESDQGRFLVGIGDWEQTRVG